jgi:uncharacterized protein (TIGR03435 family)
MLRISVALLLGALLAPGFSQTSDSSLTFEVASIKLHEPDGQAQPSQAGGPGTSDPGRITVVYRTLAALLTGAYGVKSYQVELPDLLALARYDITATVPAGATREDARAMMRNLLTDRLKLKTRRETRPMQVYALVPSKSGPKLHPSTDLPVALATGKIDADGFPIPSIDPVKGGIETTVKDLNVKLFAVKQTIAQLVATLQGQMDAPVVDLTGLTGKYDFTVRYAAQWRRANSSGNSEGDVIEGNGIKLSDAMEKELGLKLEPRKIPVEVIIVESGQKIPIDN